MLRSVRLHDNSPRRADGHPPSCRGGRAAAAAAITSYVLCERKPARRSLNAVLTESLPEALVVSFLSARQVEQTVTLLNAVLDLDNFTDEEEQLIFKHAVCQVVRAIEETLPRPFLTLCTRSAERAPSRGRYSIGTTSRASTPSRPSASWSGWVTRCRAA